MQRQDKTIIIGGGPAGLACGLWLTKNKQNNVTLFEATDQVGGISRTEKYKKFLFDLGGHRFFTKIDDVNKIVDELMKKEFIDVKRTSRIFFHGKYFDYPIKIKNVLANLGFWLSIRVLFDYFWIKFSAIFIQRPDNTFEQWITNRFGRSLYLFFFKSYTEKLWGVPCNQIGAEFAAQRIKGLSFFSAVKNALFPSHGKIKTLVDKFKFPYHGIGRISERMAEEINKGNQVIMQSKVVKVNHQGNKIISLDVEQGGKNNKFQVGNLVSSMAITDLVKTLNPKPPRHIREAAKKLTYRGLICVSLIVNRRYVTRDTWVYIHEPKATLGRIHEPKNWSKRMVPDQKKSLVVAEMWAFEDEKLWSLPDKKLIQIATSDLSDIMQFIKKDDVVDAVVVRVPRAYPTYKQGYRKHLEIIKEYLYKFKNLQLIGRYGMFRYNNMDHSILTGLYAAKNLLGSNYDIEEVNKDEEYHEEKKK